MISAITILMAIGLSWARLGIALIFSIFISFCFGILAVVNKKAEHIIIPLIDVLQSIPILGFFPIAVFLLVMYFPNYGLEMAAIFLIITSQVWNMIFAVYESSKSIPTELIELMKIYNMNWLQRIKRIYIPASMPRLIANFPVSWAVGLFFLSSSEIISLGVTSYQLFGIGSLIAQIVESGQTIDLYISFGLLILILILTHSLVFNPLYSWSLKYKYEMVAMTTPVQRPWFVSTFVRATKPFRILARQVRVPRRPLSPITRPISNEQVILPIELRQPKIWEKEIRIIWLITKLTVYSFLILLTVYLSIVVWPAFVGALQVFTNINELVYILYGIGISGVRIIISVIFMLPLIIVAVYVSLSKVLKQIFLPVFQILASIPAPLLFPLIVQWFGENRIEIISIVIIMLGSMWYVFYNTFSSIEALPNELKEACILSGLRRLSLFRKLYLPALMPGLVTGLITAVGGAWNALIVAEWLSLGPKIYSVHEGIGKIIDEAASQGNLNLMYAALIMMVVVVVVLDRTVWRKLYDYVTTHYKYEV
ncbi:MAG: ABC transporter permease subunit [Thermoprotei archaeon]